MKPPPKDLARQRYSQLKLMARTGSRSVAMIPLADLAELVRVLRGQQEVRLADHSELRELDHLPEFRRQLRSARGLVAAHLFR
jgi:hypothetical protein